LAKSFLWIITILAISQNYIAKLRSESERERERETVCVRVHACFAERFSCVFLQRERERERERVCVCVLRRDGVEVGEGCESRKKYIVILKLKQGGE
jgi:hypothetical protein